MGGGLESRCVGCVYGADGAARQAFIFLCCHAQVILVAKILPRNDFISRDI